MREEWKAVLGFNGAYEVSNYGRVRSVDRTRLVNNCHGRRSLRTDKGRELSLINHGNGYLYVSLREDGHRENRYVHRLVAEAFCDNPCNAPVVNHKNYDKTDNRACNLEWVTQKENVMYSSERMKKPKSKGRPTNTGEKYISRRVINGHVWYKVKPGQQYSEKRFKTLDEAIAYKNGVMQ